MHNTTRYFITITLFLLVAVCKIGEIRASGKADTNKTLTELAQEAESTAKNDGTLYTKFRYVTPQNLSYQCLGNALDPAIEHILKHLQPDNNRDKHNYFHQGTPPHDDIIGFIDSIFGALKTAGITFIKGESVQLAPLPSNITINLGGHIYEILYGCQSGTHVLVIRPLSNTQNVASYPTTGTRGGTQNTLTTTLDSYRVAFTVERKGYYIRSFYPSDNTGA